MTKTYTKKIVTYKNTDNSASPILDASPQSESLQRKADLTNNAAQRAESPRPNNTGMPDNLKSGIESLSGFSMDDVRVHYNSSKPATVQALAYTQGTDIHVAPGQEKHLPHEAWHVAQQMAGRVSPTTNINGMLVNDNAALEHEADVMGEKAVQKTDDKSPKNSDNYSNVIQCKNCPAYFETGNEEGCPNSRYYVFNDRYVRIAPINTRRSPTQEYHEENRNFVYVESEDACYFLENHPEIMEKIKETEYTKDITTLINEIGVNPPEKLGLFLKKYEEVISKISRIPKIGLSPYDWNSIPFGHLGHKIEDKLELYTDDKSLEDELNKREKNLDKYRERREYAIKFALNRFSEDALKNKWNTYSTMCTRKRIQLDSKEFIRWAVAEFHLADVSDIRQAIDDARHSMDDYFRNRWKEAVKTSPSKDLSRDKFDYNRSRYWRRAFDYFKDLPKFGSGLGPGVIDEDLASSSGMKRRNSAGTTRTSSTKRPRTH